MPGLLIDNREVQVRQGKTILAAARKLGIEIPTLCYMDGLGHFTSCMLCVVEDKVSNRLLPSCTAPAAGGMIIETGSDLVKEARRDALELLLKEHTGDCEAPCALACPLRIDIPLAIRQLKEGKAHAALHTIKRSAAFPAILSRICPAPCESACRRGRYDSPAAICLLMGFAAAADFENKSPYIPPVEPPTGKRVAVIGAGPAGLSACYYILQCGHSCSLYDQREMPDGTLRYCVSESPLPHSLIDHEIEILSSMGAQFQMKMKVGKDIPLNEIIRSCDAVIIAAGEDARECAIKTSLEMSDHGIEVSHRTYQTSIDGVFAAGKALQPRCTLVKAMAHGRAVAVSVHQYLRGEEVTGLRKRFHSHIGRLKDGEILEFMKEAEDYPGTLPASGDSHGFSKREAEMEAGRCLHCDCRKKDSCRLKGYAEEYGVHGRSFRGGERKIFEKIIHHSDIIYEPGKCIKCGICVRVTEDEGERLGLVFLGRGYDLRIGVPFQDLLSKALEKSAGRCVRACPTGALCFNHTHGK